MVAGAKISKAKGGAENRACVRHTGRLFGAMHRGGSVMDPARAKRAVKVAGRIAMQCAVLGFALVASARDMEYRGVIRGVVVEASGAPLAVAKVHAESAADVQLSRRFATLRRMPREGSRSTGSAGIGTGSAR